MSVPARKLSSGSYPALVLDADQKTPLSTYPLSVWPWQRTVHAVLLDRVEIIKEYDFEIRSPSFSMKLPHTVALKKDVHYDKAEHPAFTRFNLFLRDNFCCQYCEERFPSSKLTFDHVIPQSIGGGTDWMNIVAACQPCNQKKGDQLPEECGMKLAEPYIPSHEELQIKAIAYAKLTRSMHKDWHDYLYWDQELGDGIGSQPWPTEEGAIKMGLAAVGFNHGLTLPAPDIPGVGRILQPKPQLIIGG